MENQLITISKCSATGKTRYYNQGEAKEAILRIKGKSGMYDNKTKKRLKRRQGKPAQCRFYYCNHCRGYHLTSAAAHVKQKTIQKSFQLRVKNTTGLVRSEHEAETWKADGLPFPEIHNPSLVINNTEI